MTSLGIITDLKFNTPNDILNYLADHNLTYKVDPNTKEHIYVLNPETNRSITYGVAENTDRLLYLIKE